MIARKALPRVLSTKSSTYRVDADLKSNLAVPEAAWLHARTSGSARSIVRLDQRVVERF